MGKLKILGWFLGGTFIGVFGLVVVTAAFQTRGEVKGTSFSTGSAEIKFLSDLEGGTSDSNLLSEKSFKAFDLIGPNWSDMRLVKLYNEGTESLALSFIAVLSGNNSALSDEIILNLKNWDDKNNNGELDETDTTTSVLSQTLTSWQTNGVDLGDFESKEVKGYVLEFSVGDIEDNLQSSTVTYNFAFDGVTE